MTSRERVQRAFAHDQPDFPPCDYFGTPEIRASLMKFFGVDDEEKIVERLGTDIRYINPPYIGPVLRKFQDGSEMDIWGVRKKRMPNEYGDYAEAINFPYAAWTCVEQAQKFSWPDPAWYDYEAVAQMCKRLPGLAVATGGFYVQDFINSVAYGRGVEQVLIDIAQEDAVYLYIVEKRHRFYMEVIERTLEAAGGRIDFVLCGDDFGTQRGLMISPEAFNRIFAARKKELFDMVHSYGAKVSHHSCGSTAKLIQRFIEIGMDALQTIQPQALGMNPYELKTRFGGQIVFHGALDVQGWLQHAIPNQIRAEVFRLSDEVGAGGGYILSPSHNIQPDTPLENVLTLYRAIAEYRGLPETF
jgi:uroporphyrinogen decarboxylase